MELKRWLFENELSQVEFSKIIGYIPSYISNCIGGNKKPGRKFIKAVYDATEGNVKNKDWITEKEDLTLEQRKARSHSLFRNVDGRFLKKEK